MSAAPPLTSRERVRAAMAHEVPDRVPVMCEVDVDDPATYHHAGYVWNTFTRAGLLATAWI